VGHLGIKMAAAIAAAVMGASLVFPAPTAANYDSGWFVVGSNDFMRGQVIVTTTNRDATTAYVDSVWAGVTAAADCTAAADVYTNVYSGTTLRFSNVAHLRWNSPGLASDKNLYTYRRAGTSRLLVERGHGSRVVVKIDAVWFSPNCASGDSKWGTATKTAYITSTTGSSRPSPPAAVGALDAGFGKGGTVLTNFGYRDQAHAVAIEADGGILVAGDDADVDSGTDRLALARYTSAGALDSGFGRNGKVLTTTGSRNDSPANAMAIQADGKIVFAGTTGFPGEFIITRYTPKGVLDPSFGTGGFARTHFDSGSRDIPTAIALQADGKIIVAGYSEAAGNETWFALARYTTTGAADPSFGTGGKVRTHFGSSSDDFAHALAIQADGRIVVAGFSNSPSSIALARYTTDGSLDPTFGTGGEVTTSFGSGGYSGATSVVIQWDGKIVAGGSSNLFGDFALVRYAANGTLDTGFGIGGKVVTTFPDNSGLSAMALQGDGRIIVVGGTAPTPSSFVVARYSTNGRLDTTFGTQGKVSTKFASNSDGFADSVAIQADGKVVVVGSSNNYDDGTLDFAIARYR